MSIEWGIQSPFNVSMMTFPTLRAWPAMAAVASSSEWYIAVM